ncbi:hypothetical protein SISNIDRAFT_459798, partial [Sistotremastrum niveocremeum HHB9708]
MSDPTHDLPLPVLFQRALKLVSDASDLPTVDDATQALVQSALVDLKVVSSRVNALALFSDNEALEDLATRDLVYLLVPYVYCEVAGKIKVDGADARMLILDEIRRHLNAFLSRLTQYGIVTQQDVKLAKASSDIADPAKRREHKINQYKAEKELRNRVKVVCERRKASTTGDELRNDFDLIRSLVAATPSSSNDDDDEDDESLRTTTISLLRLTYAQAASQLQSLEQERALLASAPPPPSPNSAAPNTSTDDEWRLDGPLNRGLPTSGPLLDSSGRPLRPFTILGSSAASERLRLQGQVFRPDHRLPTMSIDEYLEEEKRRGNIISGGGPQSEAALTTSEQLALDAEMDGTLEGEEKSEEKRLEDERWARYTDTHRKGEGNTMNRG